MKTTIRESAGSTTEVTWEDGRLSGDPFQLAYLRASLRLDGPEGVVGTPPYPTIVGPDLTKHLDFCAAVRCVLGWSHIEGHMSTLSPLPPHVVS
jgi:hypothetical protein